MDYIEDLQEIMEECDETIAKYKRKIRSKVTNYIMNKTTKEELISEIEHYKCLIEMERQSYRLAQSLIEEEQSKP